MTTPSESILIPTFTQTVVAHGNRRAVSDADRFLTYRQLDQASDALADQLRLVPAGTRRVAVMLPRSIEASIAFLATLKAGGAYVPLDPTTPVNRLNVMLRSINADVVISGSEPLPLLEEKTAHLKFTLPDLLALSPETPAATPREPRDRNQEAYVMFTSGSTGTPKGVAIPDRAIERLAINPRYVEVTPEDIILHFAPTAFDASTFEIWAAWLNGAELVVFTAAQPTPTILGDFIEQHRCSIAWFTVGLFNTLIDTGPAVLAPLRAVLTGGDALSPEHIARAYQALPYTRIINGYGPTENTTFTCCHPIPRAPDLATWSNIPIGQAISGTSIHIVDTEMKPVADGHEGELLTGGDGVALGYLNDSALTAERFILAPYLGPGRFYRTGDLVIRRADGNVEFRGRLDDQVKINGFRIEPREIASQLKQHDAVLDAVVVTRLVARGGKRLVGYVKVDPKVQPPVTEDALREWLGDFLQPAWIPTRIIFLQFFPLTTNGKINRAVLPSPFGTGELPSTPGTNTSPDSPDFMNVVADTLAIEHVDPARSFLAAGGDSLSAMVVIDQWAQKTGQMLTVDRLLSCAALSTIVTRALTSPSPTSSLSNAEIPHGDTETGPLSLSQEQVWFIARSRPESLSYNVNCRLLFQGVNRANLWASLEVVFRRHGLLHSVLVDQPSSSTPRWERRPDWPLPLVRVDLSHLPPLEAKTRCDAEFAQRLQEPFDLRAAPLIRWFAWELPGDEIRLLQCEHHLIHDGWSLERLFRDWAKTYDNLRVNSTDRVSGPPPRSYFDLCRWQRGFIDASSEDPSLAFWRRKLVGMPHFRLPADIRETPPESSETPSAGTAAPPEGRVLRREVPPALVSKLTVAAQANGISLFEYFLSTFVGWLGPTSNRDEVGLGIGIANRTQSTFAETLGLFVNMVTLRARAPATLSSWSDFRRQVAQGLREAWPHQHVPFEQVVRQVNPERVAGQNPLFEVLFSMHQRLPRDGWFDGALTDYEEAIDNRSAKFDLTAFLIQEPAAAPHNDPRIWLRWEYRADRFDSKQMETRFDQYLGLLESALHPKAMLPWAAQNRVSDPSQSSPIPVAVDKPVPHFRQVRDAGLTQAIIDIWQPLFPDENITPDTNFFAIGGHSLLGMEVIFALESFFDRDLPLNSIFEAPTPRSYAGLLQGEDEIPQLSLSRLNQTEGQPVVFIHGWAGDAFGLLNLGRALEGEVGVYGLHADPRHGQNFNSLEKLAAFYAGYIDEKLQQPEYQIAGFSLGGLLAWAVAQALQDRGRKVAKLTVIDTRPYLLPPLLNLWVNRHWGYQRVKARVQSLASAGPQKILPTIRQIGATAIKRLPLILDGKKKPLLQPALAPGAVPDHYQVLAEAWKPHHYHGDMNIVWSTDTFMDLPAAWKAWVKGSIKVRRVQGEHLKLVEEPMVSRVAAVMIDLRKTERSDQ